MTSGDRAEEVNPGFVRFCAAPDFTRAKKGPLTPARRAGLVYEQKAAAAVSAIIEDLPASPDYTFRWMIGPWVEYFNKGASHRKRHAQPDGLLFDLGRNRLTIIEIKLSHSTRAYRQLFNLYHPLMCCLFPDMDIHLLEICSRFDPGGGRRITKIMHFPASVFDTQPGKMNIICYKPGRPATMERSVEQPPAL